MRILLFFLCFPSIVSVLSIRVVHHSQEGGEPHNALQAGEVTVAAQPTLPPQAQGPKEVPDKKEELSVKGVSEAASAPVPAAAAAAAAISEPGKQQEVDKAVASSPENAVEPASKDEKKQDKGEVDVSPAKEAVGAKPHDEAVPKADEKAPAKDAVASEPHDEPKAQEHQAVVKVPEEPKHVADEHKDAPINEHANQSQPGEVKAENAVAPPVPAPVPEQQENVDNKNNGNGNVVIPAKEDVVPVMEVEAVEPASEKKDDEPNEPPTLETLVNKGSICEKQKLAVEYLEEQLRDGPLRSIYDYKKDDKGALQRCRAMIKSPPRVCKHAGLITRRGCSNTSMFKLVDKYMAHGVCTVEAALNQMYHKEHTGDFIANEIDLLVESINLIPSFNDATKEMFSRSDSILKALRILFKNAEQALVSPSIQQILYRRWELLNTILCGIAAGKSNDIMKTISLDLSKNKIQADVDIENFITEATEVFFNAYKPLEKFIEAFETGLLVKAVKLNKDDFAQNVREIMPIITDGHQPDIKDALIDPLRKLPHGALGSVDIDKITSQIGSGVSLVQKVDEVGIPEVPADNPQVEGVINEVKKQSKNLSPTAAFRKVLVNLDMFVYKGDHIVPVLDEEKVKAMIKEALLDVSDEVMVARLIVKQQEALRTIYHIMKLLVKLPSADIVSQLKGAHAAREIKSIASFVDSKFNAIKETFAKATQVIHNPVAPMRAEAPVVPSTSMLQLAQEPAGAEAASAPGVAEAATPAVIAAQFVVESNHGKPTLDNKVNEYVDLQRLQPEEKSLLHVKFYDGAVGFASLLSVVLVAVVTIF